MVREAKKGKFATEIAKEYTIRTKKKIHPQTVCNVLHENALVNRKVNKEEVLSKENQEKRLRYAIDMRGYNWQNVLFCDEKHSGLMGAELADGKNQMTEPFGQFPDTLRSCMFGPLWDIIGNRVVFFTENLTAKLYQQILRKQLKQTKITFAPNSPRSLAKKWFFFTR